MKKIQLFKLISIKIKNTFIQNKEFSSFFYGWEQIHLNKFMKDELLFIYSPINYSFIDL